MEVLYFIGSVLNFLSVLVQGTWKLSPIGLFILPDYPIIFANPITPINSPTPAYWDRRVQTISPQQVLNDGDREVLNISPPHVLSAGDDDYGRDRHRYYASRGCRKCHHHRNSHRGRNRHRYYASGKCGACYRHRHSRLDRNEDRSREMETYSNRDENIGRGHEKHRHYRDEDSDRDRDRDEDRRRDRDSLESSRQNEYYNAHKPHTDVNGDGPSVRVDRGNVRAEDDRQNKYVAVKPHTDVNGDRPSVKVDRGNVRAEDDRGIYISTTGRNSGPVSASGTSTDGRNVVVNTEMVTDR